MIVNKSKTVSEYRVVTKKQQNHEYINYMLSWLIKNTQLRQTYGKLANAKAFENWVNPYLNNPHYHEEPVLQYDTSTLQQWRNKRVTNDKVAPNKKFPFAEDYCHYCTGELGAQTVLTATTVNTYRYGATCAIPKDPCANCSLLERNFPQSEEVPQNKNKMELN